MKLQQLQVLVHVVDHGGIRAAARQLHLSQAAVTKSMRLLEEVAGVSLLRRGSRGVEPTEAGEKLLARARLVTRQVELAQEELRQLAGEDEGRVRIGLTPYVTLTALGEAFHWFRQRYREVKVEFSEGLMRRVLPRLRDGTLDLAVVAADVGELQGDEFSVRRLSRARQHIVVREGHPVLTQPSAALLAQQEWVMTHPIPADRQNRVWAMFALAGLEPPERVVVCETLAALTLLRNSDAVGIMPEPLQGHPESRGIVAVPDCGLTPTDIELLLLARPDIPLTPAAEFFGHCVAQIISGEAGAARPQVVNSAAPSAHP
ncbi:LysR substrate-binding domain-containing protein [Ramlibacter tataouinensis]|uniref:LysR family transcriptional regulator n=1 Tax=Ramlibacter tataouinensis TaxID=94132 RepID=UPI0022F3C411|nr:LysR substrate-binding domain-containing protein [Ramlibacter tataouinensis]WBY01229.1 LysR substrate-binding domain-containing protein [Ramlibacter tataouinensis]